MTRRLETPTTSVDVATWIYALSTNDAGYVLGCAVQRIALDDDLSLAEVLGEFAERAEEEGV